MPKLILKTVAFTAAGVFVSAASARGAIPGELVATVTKVHSAAERGDYTMLRASMIKAFTWSFGGDGDIEQALSEWKRDSKYLKALTKATRGNCGWIERGVLQCPVDAGLAYRAGFKQVEGSWKMVYFVEGD